MEKMKIDIWSDIACPYCYIGKRKLEQALSEFSHADEIEIVWHSYELNPSLPKEPFHKSIYGYYADMNNYSEDDARKSLSDMTQFAAKAGLYYHFEKLVVTNTSDALRLVKLAAKHQLADQAEEVLFKAYFTDGKCISNRNTLIQLGTNIGLTETDIVAMLDSNIYLDEIKEDIRHSEEDLRLEYIPFYLFNNKDVIQGSLSAEEYLEALNKAYTDWKTNGITNGGGSRTKGRTCSPDGTCSL